MIKLVDVTKCFSDGSNVRYIFKNCNFEFKKGSLTINSWPVSWKTLLLSNIRDAGLNRGDILVCVVHLDIKKNLSR